MPPPLAGSISQTIAAPPERVWEIISGRRSPVGPIGGRWRHGTAGPADGSRFRRDVVHDGACPVYWKHLTVRESEPGRRFAFTVDLPWRIAATWAYDVRPEGDGSRVTESYQLVNAWYYRFYASWAIGYRTRHHLRAGHARLLRVKDAAEAESSAAFE